MNLKRILITGRNSYIGSHIKSWLESYPQKYEVASLDLRDKAWESKNLSQYDVLIHVAGISHVSYDSKHLDYYLRVNRDLALGVCLKAQQAGIKQFIFMSSIMVYGACESSQGYIDSDTIPQPNNIYGMSKLEAEQLIKHYDSEHFKVLILRLPMVYGKGCKGNFKRLVNYTQKAPMFPMVQNKRSMIHINNLCHCVQLMIDDCVSGVFHPQNEEYVCTSQLVKTIALVKGRKLWMPSVPVIKYAKKRQFLNKVFGDLYYAQSLSKYKRYQLVSFEESIRMSIEDVL